MSFSFGFFSLWRFENTIVKISIFCPLSSKRKKLQKMCTQSYFPWLPFEGYTRADAVSLREFSLVAFFVLIQPALQTHLHSCLATDFSVFLCSRIWYDGSFWLGREGIFLHQRRSHGALCVQWFPHLHPVQGHSAHPEDQVGAEL